MSPTRDLPSVKDLESKLAEINAKLHDVKREKDEKKVKFQG
jgi:hypothetical protein